MIASVKDTWDELAAAAEKDEVAKKALESVEEVDAALSGNNLLEESDKGFRLPYSNRPKGSNNKWK